MSLHLQSTSVWFGWVLYQADWHIFHVFQDDHVAWFCNYPEKIILRKWNSLRIILYYLCYIWLGIEEWSFSVIIIWKDLKVWYWRKPSPILSCIFDCKIHVRVSHRQLCAPWYRIILSVHVQSYIHVLTFYKKIEFHLYFDLYFSCDVLGVLEEEECKPGSSLGCLWLWGRGGLSLVERKITNKISEKLQLYHYQSVGLLTIVVEGICCTVKQLTFAFTIFCIFHDTVEWFCNYKLSWNHKDLSVWKFLELLTLYWLKFCFLKEIQRILKTKLHW